MALRQKDLGVGVKLKAVRGIVPVSTGMTNANVAEQYLDLDPDRELIIKDIIVHTRIAVVGGSADLIVRFEDSLNNLISTHTIPRASIPAVGDTLKFIINQRIGKGQVLRLDVPALPDATAGSLLIMARYYHIDENSEELNTPGVIS